jgi:hypothetical protein
MRASRTPPAGYTAAGTVVLEGNKRLRWALTIASLVALVASWFVLVPLVTALRPELAGSGGTYRAGGEALLFLGAVLVSLLVTPFVVLVVHEAVHGALYWAYTRSRPRVGWKGWYAYASAPGWYLRRNSFLVVGLAPVVLITAAAIGLAMVLPPGAVVLVIFGAVLNIAGSVGDLYICARLCATPASAVVEDRIDGLTWYLAPATANP